MFRLTLLTFIVLPLEVAIGQTAPLVEIHGQGTNGLEPIFSVVKEGKEGWLVNVDLLSHTNFDAYSWLRAPERSSSRLRLWLTNNNAVVPRDGGALASIAPAQAELSTIMSHVQRRWRGQLWWPGGPLGVKPGGFFSLSAFYLNGEINIQPITNDAVLQITPLLYRVDTNKVTARLIAFPPTKLKLMVNGEVQKLE